MRNAIFLDRDGTLMKDTKYPSDPNQVELVPGAVVALQHLMKNGFELFIVSNQSGVGRGYFSEEAMWAVHNRLTELLKEHEVFFRDSRYCTDSPSVIGSSRKPSPKMLLDLIKCYNINVEASWMIGDKPSDVEAGIAAGCRSILLRSADYPGSHLLVADSWDDICRVICQAQGMEAPN